MATSGSTDFTMNARAVIKYALEKLVVIAPEEEPSAADMVSCKTDLNMMLKGWQRTAPSLFRKAVGSVTLVANTTAYTLSPRPFRVISARYRSSDGRDLPMSEWTAEDYEDMPVKTSTGIPTAFYVDYQRDSVIMNVWQPLAAVTTETIRYVYQRRFEDVDALENDIDVPQEHLDLVGYNLAHRVAIQYGKAGSPTHAKVEEMAGYLLREAMAAEREGVVRFMPGAG
jgi:hypothetical protein